MTKQTKQVEAIVDNKHLSIAEKVFYLLEDLKARSKNVVPGSVAHDLEIRKTRKAFEALITQAQQEAVSAERERVKQTVIKMQDRATEEECWRALKELEETLQKEQE